MERYDVAIVGLGALGSAAAYYTARKGVKIIAFEQFELGHVRGASSDTSRIVRTSYDAPEYVELAKSAYKDWADLEHDSGEQLLTITGGLVFFEKDGKDLLGRYTSSLTAQKIPFEVLDAREVKRRWPQFRISDDVDALYTPDSGMAHASKSVAVLQFQARALGATIRDRTPVTRLTPQGSGVVVETSKGNVYASKVVVAADAWTSKLLEPLGVKIPLEIMQEQVTYFKPTNPDLFDTSRFPVWVYFGDETYYGFPSFGEPTIKAARDTSNNYMTPENRTFVHSPELLDQLKGFMGSFIPDEERQPLRTVTCQYTITPDRQFIIGPLDKEPNIIIALGAAHAFKFTPAIGRILSELAVDGKTSNDISSFRYSPRWNMGGQKL
ncbi:FAD dependent oxidoreductase [Xylogone sp. PMI_703]|nr:FAD dependent oxidoreductase [Xylogone sp. PMI_703]